MISATALPVTSGAGLVSRGAPILVTGMTRSGTTWVANMLDASGDVVYVNEPLNPVHPPGRSPGLLRAPELHRYQYICKENGAPWAEAYRDLLRLRYRPLLELRKNHAPSDFARAGRYTWNFLRGRLGGKRLLIADPFAVFSAEWFSRKYNFQVVVLVRHPAAIVSSRMRLRWSADFSELLAQPLLMNGPLAPFRLDVERLAREDGDMLEEGAVLWRLIYDAVDQLRRRVPEIIVVRHEDLSLDPLGCFAELYGRLELPSGEKAQRAITDATSADNPSELSTSQPHAVRLNSRAAVGSWRKHLTEEEIERIRSLTAPVAGAFYSDFGALPASESLPVSQDTPD